jgi:hypothetical protein
MVARHHTITITTKKNLIIAWQERRCEACGKYFACDPGACSGCVYIHSEYLSRHGGHGHHRVITDMHRLRIVTNRFLPESGASHLIRGICDAAN